MYCYNRPFENRFYLYPAMIHNNRHMKKGDGVRGNINNKRLLLYFKSGSLNNYSVEMFAAIDQIEALASEEMAHRLTWKDLSIGEILGKVSHVTWPKKYAVG